MLKRLLIMSMSLISLQVIANNTTQISRYATVVNRPLAAQVNPLRAIQQVHFPASVQTIGEAIKHWLRYSGSHLEAEDKQPDALKQTLKQPLPQVLRSLGPLSIEEGLTVLVGRNFFSLKRNNFSREVNFKLITQKIQQRKKS